MTIPEISATITSARTMGEMFNGLLRLHIDSEARDAVIRAQTIALQLHGQMLEILAKFEEQSTQISELREKIKQYDTWDANVDKYELVDIGCNMTVYRLKQPQTPAEIGLSFCAYCFGNRKRVILQAYYCHECKHQLGN
jgi:hypothetical protein